ncbi:MAG TPA: hypothetical protein VKB51_12050, partial [bacterium]|nr:hypothetical protein [bacterium]
PYSISVGTTYESGNLGAFETFTFTAPNSGNYSGCVGTTAKTDMAFILKDGFGVAIAPPCDDYWEDHPDEKCSTADAGISLTGGLTYSIYAENWGPVYGGATYTVTVTKD